MNFPPAYSHLELTQTDSTNLEAKRLIESGKVLEGTLVITAKTQTAGKGRLGRSWVSQEGNLFVTVIWPQANDNKLYPFLSAIAIGKTIAHFTTETPYYKWPNDVLIGNKKVSGVLIETLKGYIIIGIGINIANYPEHDTKLPATCLNNHVDKSIDIKDVLELLVHNLDKELQTDNAVIIQEWSKYAYGINSNVTVERGKKGETSGVFRGIDTNGLLILETDKGTKELISFGDVTF